MDFFLEMKGFLQVQLTFFLNLPGGPFFNILQSWILACTEFCWSNTCKHFLSSKVYGWIFGEKFTKYINHIVMIIYYSIFSNIIQPLDTLLVWVGTPNHLMTFLVQIPVRGELMSQSCFDLLYQNWADFFGLWGLREDKN